jgi:hypothetical protein
MEEAPENGKELLHSVHAIRMNGFCSFSGCIYSMLYAELFFFKLRHWCWCQQMTGLCIKTDVHNATRIG